MSRARPRSRRASYAARWPYAARSPHAARSSYAARAALALGLLALVAACGGTGSASGGPADRTVTVLAASSLTETFTDLARQYERGHPGVRVRVSFGASSTLAGQVAAGAPADVVALASTATMDRVAGAGLTDGPPTDLARNVLEVAVPRGNPGGVTGLADLARPGVSVALCAPQVPCGALAGQVLADAGVRVRPVSLERDVRAALTKVRLGEVDAALVYRTDVAAAGPDVTGVPVTSRRSTAYQVAVLRDAPNPRDARGFVDLVRSGAGRAVLARAGFEAP